MSQDASFEDLMERLRRGDEEAAQQIFQCFAPWLVGLSRTRLTGGLRPEGRPRRRDAVRLQELFSSSCRGAI